MKQSYTSQPIGVRARFREVKRLWTFHSTEAGSRVQSLVSLAEQCAGNLKEAFGFDVIGRRILDVGPGQFLIQPRYFALRNEVAAIDTEVIVEKLTPRNCLEMARRNGIQRAVKTVARKALGIDDSYERALRAKLGVAVLPSVSLVRGDACKMHFPDESFDMIYSAAVLHHVATPAAALSEMARVLRPGGVAHVALHLYSSPNGSLDPRILFGGDLELCWAHLRRGAPVVEGAFLNRLRLSEWQNLFAAQWSGSKLRTILVDDPQVVRQAGRLLSEGEFVGYSEEELLTTTIVAIWQKKPTLPQRVS
jgi:SAM-dependent methyltransferase